MPRPRRWWSSWRRRTGLRFRLAYPWRAPDGGELAASAGRSYLSSRTVGSCVEERWRICSDGDLGFVEAGFAIVDVYGDLSGAPYDMEAKRLVVVAHKGEQP